MLNGLLPGPAEAATFATAVFLLNATPGVDSLLTVSRTLQGGPRAGVAAAMGILAGCVVHTLGAAFGLAAMLALVPHAFEAIQWAGAGYLVWLGQGLLRQAWRPKAAATRDAAGAPAGSTERSSHRSAWADLRTGLLTNVLNPKVALFFLAFLPQFVPPDSPHKTASFLLLGAWFVVQGLLFLLMLVALAARLAKLAPAPALSRGLSALGGVLFIGLALRLLRERPVPT
jgi:threonine/homoserine/homoserine lactone efflux protein